MIATKGKTPAVAYYRMSSDKQEASIPAQRIAVEDQRIDRRAQAASQAVKGRAIDVEFPEAIAIPGCLA